MGLYKKDIDTNQKSPKPTDVYSGIDTTIHLVFSIWKDAFKPPLKSSHGEECGS